MNAALAGRVRQLDAARDYRASVAEYHAMAKAARRARTSRILAEIIQDLAELSDGPAGVACFTCRRALAPRVRTCPHCRDAHQAAS